MLTLLPDEDRGTTGPESQINMRINLDYRAQSRQFHSVIKTQKQLALKEEKSRKAKGKRAQTTGHGGRRKQDTNYDIKIRPYAYKGVPDQYSADVQVSVVQSKKQHREKVLQERARAGCSLFKYRNSKAFQYERQQLQKGITIRDANLHSTSQPSMSGILPTAGALSNLVSIAAHQPRSAASNHFPTVEADHTLAPSEANLMGSPKSLLVHPGDGSQGPSLLLLDEVLETLRQKN